MKLPEPVTVAIVFATGEEIPGYTVEQMLAWGKANAEAEREACAKVCESHVRYPSRLHFAAAIRARGNT
jgi:hypothetical protein